MSKHDILKKYNHISVYQVNKKDTFELFQFLVRRIYNSGKYEDYLTHLQMSRLVFDDPDSVYLKRIIVDYGNYFIRKGAKKKLDYDLIYEEHPRIWTGKKEDKTTFSKENIISAIDDEIKETYRSQKNNYINIKDIRLISTINDVKIYSSKLIIENDDFVSFSEGMQAKLIFNNYPSQKVTILEYNSKKETLSFQTITSIIPDKAKVNSSSVSLLFRLKDRLGNINEDNYPIWDLVKSNNFPKNIFNSSNIWDEGLDNSQTIALKRAISNNISYIWGPPGTGKSHTLSRLLLNFYNKKERTVVCAIANVAVDGLLLKTVDVFNNDYFNKTKKNLLSERRIIRLGYSQSEEIRDIPEIKFENPKLIELSEKLNSIYNRLEGIKEKGDLKKHEEEKLGLLSQKDKLKKEYDDESKKMLSDSKIIFLTSSKFILEESINELEIDNLVIDEGSMMSIPILLALSQKVRKRIIITGDFRQLGPIALSNSSLSKRWLHPSLFSLLGEGDSIIKHKAISMLTEQRRSAPAIAELINYPFYDNRLTTELRQHHKTAINLGYSIGHISFLDLPNDETNSAEYSKNKSKYNSLSRRKVIELLTFILEQDPHIESIGIITPYRQQVMDYKRDLESLDFNKNQVRVGTIHTFQGSECDIIIWDIVDTVDKPIGSLYKSVTGERLVNVAVSRAKSKLIIVGNHRIFNEVKGGDTISSKIKMVLNDAWKVYTGKIKY